MPWCLLAAAGKGLPKGAVKIFVRNYSMLDEPQQNLSWRAPCHTGKAITPGANPLSE